MSKFSNLLKLLTILKSKNRMKSKEIAQALGVSERMVRKYIDDLQQANINIESIPGPNGGYQLMGYDYLLNININDEEIQSLELAVDELKRTYIDYEYIKNLENFTEKIKINNNNKDSNQSSIVCESTPIYIVENKEYELQLQTASIIRNKVRMNYSSVSSGDKVRIIRPYTIITRNSEKYLIAYCEARQEVRTFKLIRIKWIEILEEKFDIDESFNIKDYMKDTIGVFNDEEIKLKLLIKKPFSYSVSEKIYVDNQVIIHNDDESIIFIAKMNGKPDVIKWILSMSTYVTILEPKELKEEIKNTLKKMIKSI